MLNWIHSLKIVFLYRLSHFFNRVLWDSKAFNFDEICFFFLLFIYVYLLCLYVPKEVRKVLAPKVGVPGSTELPGVGAGH